MSTMLSCEIPSSTGLVSRPVLRLRWVAHIAALAGAVLSTACTFGAGAVAHAETGGASPPGYTDEVDANAQGVDPATDSYADTDPSALTDFREPLSPYGSWVEDSAYGTVWVPSTTVVGSDFAPYQSAGHWALDDDEDWIWVSDYDWGYIPFHYGRWVWLSSSGWGWIPGRTYSSAWVNWRVGEGGYIGWAPMPPAWYWYGGVATGLWVTPYAAYCFVPTAYAFHEHVSTYVVRDRAVVSAAAATTRPYTPAHPTVGGSAPHGAGARSGGFRTASPRMGDVGIAPANAPRTRIPADNRAAAFATRSGSASIRHSAFGAPLPSSHRGVAADAWQTHGSAFDRGQTRTLDRSQPVFERGQQDVDRASRAPAFDRGASSGREGAGSPVLRTPTRDYPRAAPSYSSAPVSRPSFTASPAARPSAPVYRPSAPAFRPSAPAYRPAAPSFHSAPSAPSRGSGGGRHR